MTFGGPSRWEVEERAFQPSPASPSGGARWPARCPAASSRCWPWRARSRRAGRAAARRDLHGPGAHDRGRALRTGGPIAAEGVAVILAEQFAATAMGVATDVAVVVQGRIVARESRAICPRPGRRLPRRCRRMSNRRRRGRAPLSALAAGTVLLLAGGSGLLGAAASGLRPPPSADRAGRRRAGPRWLHHHLTRRGDHRAVRAARLPPPGHAVARVRRGLRLDVGQLRPDRRGDRLEPLPGSGGGQRWPELSLLVPGVPCHRRRSGPPRPPASTRRRPRHEHGRGRGEHGRPEHGQRQHGQRHPRRRRRHRGCQRFDADRRPAVRAIRSPAASSASAWHVGHVVLAAPSTARRPTPRPPTAACRCSAGSSPSGVTSTARPARTARRAS